MGQRQRRKRRKWLNKAVREGWVFIGRGEPQSVEWSALTDPCNWSPDPDVRIWNSSALHPAPPKIQ